MSAAAHKKGPTTASADALRWRALLDTRPSGPALLDTRGKCSGCAFERTLYKTLRIERRNFAKFVVDDTKFLLLSQRTNTYQGYTCSHPVIRGCRASASIRRCSHLLAIEHDGVLFRYKDYRDGGAWKTKWLPGVEFIERFLRHVLLKDLRHVRRFGVWGNRGRTEKRTLLRGLLNVKPPEPLDEALPTSEESEIDEPLNLDLLQWEAEQGTPRKCRNCGGTRVETYQTPRPTVAQLMRMPPTMELPVETGPLQMHLPTSAFS